MQQIVFIEWESGTVVEAKPLFVTARTAKGRNTKLAYENIRPKSKTKLSVELSPRYMEDPYVCTAESIDAARYNAIFNDREFNSPGSPQLTNNTDEAPVSSAPITTSDDVNLKISDQVIKRDEKDIGELSERVRSIEDVKGHSLSSQRQIVLQSLRSQTNLRQVTEKDKYSAPRCSLDDTLKDELATNWKGDIKRNP